MSDWSALPLPPGIRSRTVETDLDLTVHYLESGEVGAPVLLLLHGFPELSFSWRKIMVPLAQAGFHVIAPDQRGYGRTLGWADGYDVDLEPYRMPSLVLDQLSVLKALSIDSVHAVVGHDFGSPVAAWCALIRPDIFEHAVLMSAPFAGPPRISRQNPDIDGALAQLKPPRKHYQWYYSEPEAEADMLSCTQGFRTFLAQYYFLKSAAWQRNAPHKLASWRADQLAVMPGYYIMPKSESMATVVSADCEGEDLSPIDAWLTAAELDVYAAEFSRTGLQGGLNWYRASTSFRERRSSLIFAGTRIEIPVLFIAGQKDWGMFQSPGALEAMQAEGCRDFRGSIVIPNAGHWVQQEQPQAVIDAIFEFLSIEPAKVSG